MSENNDTPTIDMTSQADQEFMDAEVEPEQFDPVAHYEQTLEFFEERGWDTSRLEPPDGYEEDGEGNEREEGPQQGTDAEDSAEKGFAKADDEDALDRADEALLEAHEKAVQWKANTANPDLSKSPGIWESQDQVPDFVLEALEDLIRAGDVVWSGDYERLPPGADAEIKRILEQKMTQPQGWSLQSLYDDLSERYPEAEKEYLISTLRNETSAVLNTAREEAYNQRDDVDEHVFDWIGPNDHRTTETCSAIKDEIEDRGGAVPMSELKEILYEKALEHADAEGTPERVDDWQPHWQCRHTFTRRVQSI